LKIEGQKSLILITMTIFMKLMKYGDQSAIKPYSCMNRKYI